MPKNIIVFSGKKGSGKSAAAKFTFATYINRKIGEERFIVQKRGKEAVLIDKFNYGIVNTDFPNPELNKLIDCYSVKIYSFADPLKQICIEVLGLDVAQCYGSDDDKNSKTHILWENISKDILDMFKRPKRGTGQNKHPSGPMTGREVMEVFGTYIFRQADETCWARALYNKIENDGHSLSIISDCRFPNEVTMGTEMGAKVVRLLRNPYDAKTFPEMALDHFPEGEYSLILDNSKILMGDTHKKLKKFIVSWF